jgi:hypothetical protein
MRFEMVRNIALVVIAAIMLAGCSGMNRQQQRALSGGAIGAAGGAAIAAIAGGPVLLGAGLGAAGGAAVGALTH